MCNGIKICLFFFILAALLFSGCAGNQTGESGLSEIVASEMSSDQPIAFKADKSDENIEMVKENEQSNIELNVYKTACAGEDDDLIDVRVNSVEAEKGQIKSVETDEYKYFSLLYNNSLNEDMSLDSDYVYISVNITLHGGKSFDRLYLSSFRLYYSLDGEEYFGEMAYQSAMDNPDNPHDVGVISYTAEEEKNVTIGYIVPNQILNSENVCLLAAFADDGNTEKSPMFKIADGTTFE